MLGSADSVDAEQLGCRLPHTRAWLAAASGQLPHVEQLEALSAGASNDSDAVPQQQALPHLRAGLRSFVASAAAAEGGAAGPRHPPLHTPVEARSWRGLVRLGLVQLVSGEGAVGRLPLPETLRLDAARLHAAQVRGGGVGRCAWVGVGRCARPVRSLALLANRRCWPNRPRLTLPFCPSCPRFTGRVPAPAGHRHLPAARPAERRGRRPALWCGRAGCGQAPPGGHAGGPVCAPT